VIAASGASVFLGDDLLAYLVLAVGGALIVGNVLALIRPPDTLDRGDLRRAPVGRTIFMTLIGVVAAGWSLASLISK
jgi:hypothetical protein